MRFGALLSGVLIIWTAEVFADDAYRLFFVSDRDTQGQTRGPGLPIYEHFTMALDGTSQIKLSQSNSRRLWPYHTMDQRSADGQSVLGNHFSQSGRSSDIALFDLDGNVVSLLTDWAGSESFPQWSPDETSIAFHSSRDRDRDGGQHDVFVMNSDGSNVVKVTGGRGGEWPTWSPDGSRVAYVSGTSLYSVIEKDGENRVLIADVGEPTHMPTWTHATDKIAFATAHPSWDIYVVNSDGSGLLNISDHPAEDFRPQWSPDGQYIAFDSDREGNIEIYLASADGGQLTNLTNHPADDLAVRWIPSAGMALTVTKSRSWGHIKSDYR